MFIKKTFLNGFRNFKNQELYFSKGKNLLFGLNGIGKTSLLEANYFLAFGKSIFSVKREEMKNFDLDFFYIFSLVEGMKGENCLSATYDETSIFRINNLKSSILDHFHYLYPIFFSSNTFSFIIDHRDSLRKMIDRFIYGVNDLYLHYILRYNRILRQKNHLLRTPENILNENELDTWNLYLAEMGSKIIDCRFRFIESLNTCLSKYFKGFIKIEYRSFSDKNNDFSKKSLFNQLSRQKTIEKRIKKSIVGPHRDFYEIYVKNTRINLLSSGEKKKNLLMLYLGYIQIFKNENMDSPVLFIDDFDSALDENNFHFLFEHLPDIQIIATSVNQKGKFDHFISLSKEN